MIARTPPRGITLVQTLVCIAIIGVLIGLLVPAVQWARESARRLECTARFKNLGLALQGYHAAHGYFPSLHFARELDSRGFKAGGTWFTPHLNLLPFLEWQSLYDQINHNPPGIWHYKTNVFPGNATAAQTQVAAFICPSDGGPFSAGTSYRYCIGWGPYATARHGPFTRLECYAARDFGDGLAKTVGLSERMMGDGQTERFDRRRDFWYLGTEIISMELLREKCQGAPAAGDFHYSWMGHYWMNGGIENVEYNHFLGPNPEIADCSVDRAIQTLTVGGVFAARSNHAGGVNAVLMDGSVQWYADAISLAVWRALASRNGGETMAGAVR